SVSLGLPLLISSALLARPPANAPTFTDTAPPAICSLSLPDALPISGVATVSSTSNGVLKLYKAGPTNISATDGSISTSAPLAVTVGGANGSPPATDPAPTTPAACTGNNLTVTALHAYRNTASAYTRA